MTGAAGALAAFQQTAINPSGSFAQTWTLSAVLMTVIGGAGTVTGPIVGVLVISYGLTLQLQDEETLSAVIEGVLLLAIVRFAPWVSGHRRLASADAG